MKDLIIDTFLAAKRTLLLSKRYNCFEFFGYDFLIDEDLRVWLIEVRRKRANNLLIIYYCCCVGQHKSIHWSSK